MWWIQASNHFLHKPMDWEEWISYIGSMDEDPFYSLHVIYMVEALNSSQGLVMALFHLVPSF